MSIVGTIVRARAIALTAALLLLCGLVSAQGYTIRVTYNTNLRSTYSLQGDIVETAQAGTTLLVIGNNGRWLQIDRNGIVWMADWVGHTRVESSQQTQSQQQSFSQIDNCCYVDRQCDSDQEWTDGYWAFQNNQCASPSGSQTQTSSQTSSTVSSQIDNCCHVDRQCDSDQEWTDGYWAFQNNQCASPSGSQTQTSSQTSSTVSSQINNCCFLGWQCHSDEDWRSGYQAYQNNQCDESPHQPQVTDIPAGIDNCCRVNRQCNSDEDWTRGWLAFKHFQCKPPPVTQGLSIKGGAGFVSQMTDALYLLRESAPQWWKYATSGLDRIVQDLSNDVPGIDVEKRRFHLDYTDHIPAGYEATHIFDLASMLVHEACHVHRHEAGSESGGLPGESDCLAREVEVYHALDPHNQNSAVAGLKKDAQTLLSNIHRPECQWWTGEYSTGPGCR